MMHLPISKRLSAERTSELSKNSNYFFQHQKVYTFSLPFIQNKEILDIGSGGGYGTYRLSQKSKVAYGLDQDYSAIINSKIEYKRDNLYFVHSSIENYKITKKFGCITCFQFIEHVKNQDLVIKKIANLLNSNGLLIISTPNALTQSFNENPYHYKELSLHEFTSLLSTQFKKVEIYGLFGDKKIKQIDDNRKKITRSLFALDPLFLRNHIPRSIRQRLFDFSAFLMSTFVIANKNEALFSESNFFINKKTNNCMDFIAVCRK